MLFPKCVSVFPRHWSLLSTAVAYPAFGCVKIFFKISMIGVSPLVASFTKQIRNITLFVSYLDIFNTFFKIRKPLVYLFKSTFYTEPESYCRNRATKNKTKNIIYKHFNHNESPLAGLYNFNFEESN